MEAGAIINNARCEQYGLELIGLHKGQRWSNQAPPFALLTITENTVDKSSSKS